MNVIEETVARKIGLESNLWIPDIYIRFSGGWGITSRDSDTGWFMVNPKRDWRSLRARLVESKNRLELAKRKYYGF